MSSLNRAQLARLIRYGRQVVMRAMAHTRHAMRGSNRLAMQPIRICFPELPANTSAASREVPDF